MRWRNVFQWVISSKCKVVPPTMALLNQRSMGVEVGGVEGGAGRAFAFRSAWLPVLQSPAGLQDPCFYRQSLSKDSSTHFKDHQITVDSLIFCHYTILKVEIEAIKFHNANLKTKFLLLLYLLSQSILVRGIEAQACTVTHVLYMFQIELRCISGLSSNWITDNLSQDQCFFFLQTLEV